MRRVEAGARPPTLGPQHERPYVRTVPRAVASEGNHETPYQGDPLRGVREHGREDADRRGTSRISRQTKEVGGMKIVSLAKEKWQIGEPLGEGGVARVYAANARGVEAAAKFVPKEVGANRDLIAKKLRGVPNVIPSLTAVRLKTAM